MERLKDILSNLGPAGDRVEVLEGIKPALSALSRKDMEVPVVSSNIFLSQQIFLCAGRSEGCGPVPHLRVSADD